MRHLVPAALLLAALGLSVAPAATQAQDQPLTHDDYDRWEEIEAQALSDDGAWVRYRTSPPKGDDTLQVKRVDPRQTYTVPRGEAAQFTTDTQFVVYQIAPPYDSTRQARLDDVPPPKRPKPALGLLSLATGDTTRVDRVQSYKLPDGG
ncbi:MAG: hypothetical protein V5A58_13000, partial [Salinibacter sp.]